MVIGGFVAAALVGTGVAAAVTIRGGSPGTPHNYYFTGKPSAQPGAAIVVPTLSRTAARSMDELDWGLVGVAHRSSGHPVVYGVVVPICSKVTGAVVTTTATTTSVRFYGKQIVSCHPSGPPPKSEYAVKIAHPVGSRTITGMNSPQQLRRDMKRLVPTQP